MTHPNVPDRGTSEEGMDTVMTAVETHGASLHLARVLVPVRATLVVGMMMRRVLRATNATVAEAIAVSATKQTEKPPPVNVIIGTKTFRGRLLAPGLLWMMRMMEVSIQVQENARKLKRNTTLG